MDYIIVGGGPAGLTAAWLLSKSGKRCTILESAKQIGGCHSVRRENGLFSEHGPRIYSGSFVNFKALLKDLGTSFDDLFTRYWFSISTIGGKTTKSMTWGEIWAFFKAYIGFSFGVDYKTTSMAEFMKSHKFTEKTRDYIDRLCRLTDGAASDNYSVYKFLQLLNQEAPYILYQPKQPNDEGLLGLLWKMVKFLLLKILFWQFLPRIFLNLLSLTSRGLKLIPMKNILVSHFIGIVS
jgi:hypothetical protein